MQLKLSVSQKSQVSRGIQLYLVQSDLWEGSICLNTNTSPPSADFWDAPPSKEIKKAIAEVLLDISQTGLVEWEGTIRIS